jgi:hypothetical protein
MIFRMVVNPEKPNTILSIEEYPIPLTTMSEVDEFERYINAIVGDLNKRVSDGFPKVSGEYGFMLDVEGKNTRYFDPSWTLFRNGYPFFHSSRDWDLSRIVRDSDEAYSEHWNIDAFRKDLGGFFDNCSTLAKLRRIELSQDYDGLSDLYGEVLDEFYQLKTITERRKNSVEIFDPLNDKLKLMKVDRVYFSDCLIEDK